MSRFDSIKFDIRAREYLADFKSLITALEDYIESNLTSPRAKALALTKLEEVYMWIGKAIRDDQIALPIYVTALSAEEKRAKKAGKRKKNV